MNPEIKQSVHDYWNRQPCGTEFSQAPVYSKAYFDEIEAHRYAMEPEIFSFAQFTRFSGKRVLEVGVGAGTDCLQWARTGAEVYGVDLTEEAIEHVRRRLSLYGFSAHELRVADAEQLPFPSDFFDLSYSWGVIHHTPDTERALGELVRVTRPGGEVRVMVYNRHSIFAALRFVRYGLMKGRFQGGISAVLAEHLESPGTQAFTAAELRAMAAKLPVELVSLSSPVSRYDLPARSRALDGAIRALAAATGDRIGWFLMMILKKRS